MKLPALVAACGLLLALPGCAAVTVYEVATMPVRTAKSAVKTASKTHDLLTTSQGERDQKLGRKIRKRQERLERLERRYARLTDDCADGTEKACEQRYGLWQEIEDLRHTLPPEERDRRD